MAYNIGLNIVETDGKATPSIQPAPTSVAAFIIRAERGVPGEVYPVTNWSQFQEHFGSFMEGAYGAYAVRGFFDNGGNMAYVTRIVKTEKKPGDTIAEATPATLTIGNLTISAGYLGKDDPGAWGNKIGISIARNRADKSTPNNPDTDPLDYYDLYVAYDGKIVETHEKLSKDTTKGRDPKTVINDEFSGSKYIKVDLVDGDNPSVTPPEIKKDGSKKMAFFNLNGDGADDGFKSDEDANTSSPDLATMAADALPRFNTKEVQLVCCPESHNQTWVTAARDYCADRGDCMFIGHTPIKFKASEVKDSYSTQFKGDKEYGALYFPWIRVAGPNGKPKWIPPTGHIFGVYARTDLERGVWKAPAGNAAKLNGALDVEHHITDVDHTSLVKDGSVNAVRYIPGVGIVIDSSRTLSTNTLWLYVNVRLLFNFVKSSLKKSLRWVVQEPNTEELWNKIKYNSVTPFLMDLWRRGAFGPGSPEEVFTVKVDKENNPPANIQNGLLTVEVYFYPSRPAETIVITVGQQEGIASASEG